MSKLNSFRIVNLNYNNNTMKIDDEIFDLGGDSTLMSLRNGGGKSVMVQMMIAPFVTKRYRDMKDREFKSYFTTNSPTYILTEWLLDDDKTNVLIGMMIKKKTYSCDDEDNDEIDIINFVHEYKEESKYSIRNIPFIEINEKSKTIKNFSSSKTLFEKLKKDPNIDFNYYTMNTPSQSRSYFDKLKEYKINNKEWESIIKEINKKESGLSELFSDCKTISGLVEKWFIKVVGDKLNQNKDKIKGFQELSKKYIYQYKENKHKLNKKEAIEKFEIMSKSILTSAQEFKDVKDNTYGIENKIANLIVYLNNCVIKEEKNINGIEKNINDIELYINDLEYEKISFELHKMEEEYNGILYKEENINKEILYLKENIKIATHNRNIMDCALEYESYQYSSKEIQGIENQIQIIKLDEKDLQPERENYGYTLKVYYSNLEKKLNEELLDNINNLKEVKNKIDVLNDNIDNYNKNLQSKNIEKGRIEGSINHFDDEEKRFNDTYKKYTSRNIMGLYEEDFIIKAKLAYDKKLEQLKKERDNFIIEEIKVSEDVEINNKKEREISITSNQLENNKIKLHNELDNINKNIEKRKNILKYIDLNETYMFDDEYISSNLNKKIERLDKDRQILETKIQNIQSEKLKLISGRNIEISKEIEEKLNSRDINFVYGMQWLKENNYSEEENLKLVKFNPLLPFSIIINKSDIENMKKDSLDIFTSSPLPIVERENLDKSVGICENEIFIIDNSKFLLSFNEKLLNENKLEQIIKNLKDREEIINEDIVNKNYEMNQYRDLSYYISQNPLSKNIYDKLQQSIKDNIKSMEKNDEDLRLIKELIKSSIERKNVLNKIKEKNILMNNNLTREYEDFNLFSEKYEEYIKSKEKLIEIEDEIRRIEIKSGDEKKSLHLNTSKLENIKESKVNIESKLKLGKENKSKYVGYNKGEIINKDIEDLEARFESLTTKISSKLEELEYRLSESIKRQQRDEEKLIEMQTRYNLVDSDYNTLIYNKSSRQIIEDEIKAYKDNEKIKEKEERKNLEIKIKIKTNIENLYKTIKNNFDKDFPKDKNEVKHKDFNKIIINQKNNKDILYKNKIATERNINTLNTNLQNLDEFNYLNVIEEIALSINLNELRDYVGKTKRDYNASKDAEEKSHKILRGDINKVKCEEEFINDDFFKKSLKIIDEISYTPKDVISNLNQTLESYKIVLDKLNADIEFIKKEEDKIIEILYDYINEVHININKIDRNSSIRINNKDVKMLNIKVDNWEENKDIYKLRTRNLLESLTNSCLDKLSQNENIEETISKTVTTKNLYNEVVSISSIDIKLYKIEENRHRIISWEQVCKNSGGEGFLSAFVVLNSLLSYMRKDAIDLSDMWSNKEDSKVIVMDNPFAQTNAEHLLKPLMEISKKSNTQLICFSGLKGDSIYNRFDNIYVLDIINSKLKNSLSYLRGNHYKGEEHVQEIISSRFEIKEEVVDQMTLF